jgi:predicted amidohydrolase
MEIKDINDLVPIVVKTVKNTYGTEIEGIKIIKTDRSVYRWHVTAEFEDPEQLYTVIIDVYDFSGDVVNIVETERQKKEKIKPTERLGVPASHIQTETVHISETEQEIVRIAVAQISFDLTESFPFVIKNKDVVKTKVFSALEIAKKDGANIVCLPELCLCEDWIGEIKEQCPDMIVIGGSFYKDNQNTCPVIMKSDAVIPRQPKITPAATEYDMGKFVILICTDFDDLAHYFREADIDMIFCPAFNSANERFQNEAHSHVERTPSYILIANTGLHGGTSIFGQLDNKYFGELADRGCRERKDPTYKLCEVKEGCEEVILADFNLIHKSVQKPTPSNRSKVIKSVDHIRKISIPQQS